MIVGRVGIVAMERIMNIINIVARTPGIVEMPEKLRSGPLFTAVRCGCFGKLISRLSGPDVFG